MPLMKPQEGVGCSGGRQWKLLDEPRNVLLRGDFQAAGVVLEAATAH
jgi:hypothetical protein